MKPLSWCLGLIFSLAIGCTTRPTRVTESVARNRTEMGGLLETVKLTPDTVVFDARTRFDFSMARVPRSISVDWKDYSEREPNQSGWPQADLFAITRKLARMGVQKSTPVVVVGLGKHGRGEEGQFAWLLSYLGVDNVQMIRFDSLKGVHLTTEAPPEELQRKSSDRLLDQDGSGGALQPQEPAAQSVPMWKPDLDDSLIVRREELNQSIEANAAYKQFAYKKRQPLVYRYIDVRSAHEYLIGSSARTSGAIPPFDAINIPWQQFFLDDLRVDSGIGKKIRDIQILPTQRIVVLDEEGISAKAVCMALRALGFKWAGAYAGGYQDFKQN